MRTSNKARILAHSCAPACLPINSDVEAVGKLKIKNSVCHKWIKNDLLKRAVLDDPTSGKGQ